MTHILLALSRYYEALSSAYHVFRAELKEMKQFDKDVEELGIAEAIKNIHKTYKEHS